MVFQLWDGKILRGADKNKLKSLTGYRVSTKNIFVQTVASCLPSELINPLNMIYSTRIFFQLPAVCFWTQTNFPRGLQLSAF